MKKIIEKIIIYLSRKDYTVEKIKNYNLYFMFIYIFLSITIGISWQFKPKFDLHINLITWWTLVILQNSSTLFLYLYRKNLPKVHSKYLEELMKEKNVTVGYPDSKFTVGQIFKIEETQKNANTLFGTSLLFNRYSTPKEGIFNGYYAGLEIIETEKVFKFISSQKNRKMKLQKLANITK